MADETTPDDEKRTVGYFRTKKKLTKTQVVDFSKTPTDMSPFTPVTAATDTVPDSTQDSLTLISVINLRIRAHADTWIAIDAVAIYCVTQCLIARFPTLKLRYRAEAVFHEQIGDDRVMVFPFASPVPDAMQRLATYPVGDIINSLHGRNLGLNADVVRISCELLLPFDC